MFIKKSSLPILILSAMIGFSAHAASQNMLQRQTYQQPYQQQQTYQQPYQQQQQAYQQPMQPGYQQYPQQNVGITEASTGS